MLDEFYVNTACHDGYASACSDCAKREAAERQKRNRVAYNARHKRWRHANLKGYREKGDHIVPLAEGGEHSYANVQVAHVFCNRSKGGRLGAAITNAKEAMA